MFRGTILPIPPLFLKRLGSQPTSSDDEPGAHQKVALVQSECILVRFGSKMIEIGGPIDDSCSRSFDTIWFDAY